MSGPLDSFLDLSSRRIRLHLRDWGGSGPPLVLLHGLASSCRIWDLTAPYLARRLRVVAVDQRGHGLSDVPDGGDDYTFEKVTGDLLAVVEALRLDRPVIAGHSWGASVALQFAAEHPGSARGIALIDGGFLHRRMMEGMTWEKAEQQMRPPPIDGVNVEDFLRLARNWPDIKELWTEQLADMLLSNFRVEEGRIYRRLPVQKHMLVARAIWEQEPARLFPQVTCPALLVAAVKDPQSERERGWLEAKRQGAELALRGLRQARVIWMEDTIHDVPVQRPRELAEAVIEFAAGLR